jgi:hypothetical protein
LDMQNLLIFLMVICYSLLEMELLFSLKMLSQGIRMQN